MFQVTAKDNLRYFHYIQDEDVANSIQIAEAPGSCCKALEFAGFAGCYKGRHRISVE